MGKSSEDKFRGVKRVSPAPTIGRETYKQRSGIEYQVEYFDLYEKELKTDLCWAIDTKNLELLEYAYKEARKLLGVSKGRPKSIPPHIQQYREEAKAHFCLYLSQLLGESYSDIWAGFFQNKNQPKKPEAETPKDLVTEVDIPSMPTLQLPNFSEEQQKAYEESMAQMMETIKEASSYSSTYTMTTGDKARHIIREMIAGEELIYRSSTQANMGIELSGFAMLGEAFVLELKKCLPDLVSEVKDATSGDSSINP